MDSLAHLYLTDVVAQFHQIKRLTERAVAQVSDADLVRPLDGDANSIAAVLQHMSGNLKSRWTDFLTTDGEKPDRDRDAEFVVTDTVSREGLLAAWEVGWDCVWSALGSLRPEDLLATVTVRGEPHTVPQAIHRQMTHQAYHAGQIVLLARHWAGDAWQTLSVPKGKSKEFNAQMMGHAAGR
jgi:uncharacterized damage-inducible protein DinB